MSAPPKDLLKDVEKGAKLKHAEAPKVDVSIATAKTMKAIEAGADLKHVEKVKGEGLTEVEKKAYLEDKAEKKK